MKTFYIKIPCSLYIGKEKEDLTEEQLAWLNGGDGYLSEFESHYQSSAIQTMLNRLLLRYGIQADTFEYYRKLVMDDLVEYTRGRENFPTTIKSIMPIHFKVTDNFLSAKDLNEEKTRDVYLYVKVDITEDLTKEQKDILFNYLEGQMSDGWGEGFEQQYITGWLKVKDKYELVIVQSSPSWNSSEYEIVNDIKD